MTAALPGADRLMAALAATWPPFATSRCGPFTLREGRGAGRRVSAATTDSLPTEAEIAAADSAMRAMGQAPVFCLRPGQEALHRQLFACGYTEQLDTDLLVGPAAPIAAEELPRVSAFAVWEPLAIIREIWAEDGIGPERQEVMARVPLEKTAILARTDDQPAGAAFVAVDGEVAMMHALVTRPGLRRRGAGRHATIRAARFAVDCGARYLALAVTADNAGAQALYTGLGMRRAGAYTYLGRPGKSL